MTMNTVARPGRQKPVSEGAAECRILGIDPGSRVTGFGVLDSTRSSICYVASGCLRVDGRSMTQRLKLIFEELSQVITEYRPVEVAIETVFLNRNADSALKLGQARGAAVCAAVMHDLEVSEYSPTQIKQALVGKGNAAKPQVQHMVQMLLQLDGRPQADAADALAVALCHQRVRQTLQRMNEPHRFARSRFR